MKQISFMDSDGVIRGGILLDDNSVICGCCGGVYSSDEVGKIEDGAEVEIIEKYDFWVDISNEIIGN